MRALLILAAAVTITACSGPGTAEHGKPMAVPLTVGCDQIIGHVRAPAGRPVLGAIMVPPTRLAPAAPTGSKPWAYFAKSGIAIRAGSPAILITVSAAWRQRAGISWGNDLGVASSLRLPACPRSGGAWDIYVGGFYLRSGNGCVPLAFRVGQQTATRTFTIGKASCG
jgi:hypothetical protein